MLSLTKANQRLNSCSLNDCQLYNLFADTWRKFHLKYNKLKPDQRVPPHSPKYVHPLKWNAKSCTAITFAHCHRILTPSRNKTLKRFTTTWEHKKCLIHKYSHLVNLISTKAYLFYRNSRSLPGFSTLVCLVNSRYLDTTCIICILNSDVMQ